MNFGKPGSGQGGFSTFQLESVVQGFRNQKTSKALDSFPSEMKGLLSSVVSLSFFSSLRIPLSCTVHHHHISATSSKHSQKQQQTQQATCCTYQINKKLRVKNGLTLITQLRKVMLLRRKRSQDGGQLQEQRFYSGQLSEECILKGMISQSTFKVTENHPYQRAKLF